MNRMQVTSTPHSEAHFCLDRPVYRVNFWSRVSADVGWNLEAFSISDAVDVHEVCAWAAQNAHGRRLEVFVESEDEPTGLVDGTTAPGTPRRASLVRLVGSNPNAPEA